MTLNFFQQVSMRFHGALAPLEPQIYFVARPVWTENVLLVSGRLVIVVFWQPKF